MHTSRTPSFFGKAVPLLGMAALALTASRPAQAQAAYLTLSDGDAVAVSSAGTTGTINNNTASYSNTIEGGYTVQANGTASFALGTGGTLTSGVNGTTLDSKGSGPITITDGSIKGGNGSTGISISGSSSATFSGGTLTTGNSSYGIDAEGTGPVVISGGTITSGNSKGTFRNISTGVYAGGAGPVTISGGTLIVGTNDTGVTASGTGLLTISGGEIHGGLYGFGLAVETGGQALITGGTITSGGPVVPGFFGPASGPGDGVAAMGGVVTITGGSITGGNSSGSGLSASSGGIINLFSLGDSDFYINGVAINNTSLTDYRTGILTGTLLDGEALDTPFVDDGTFNFNVGNAPESAAPEPSALAVWAFVGLGAAGLVLKAKKRKATAV